ncbi:response regulator [Phenylobacterium sp.]|uniref:response regulator n=1 Tax=Phenylobacterium sp. TaxID=1871053 RepID=UPI00122A4389|nr:response regulator [Phenylobacterium sp.]THD70482.1 MAG: response regulator [Phenylobacterium sp.]
MAAEPGPSRHRWAADLEPPDLTAPLRAKVLIVDDDERNAFAAVQALEELGHDLVVAPSGDDALRRLLHDDFAVILLDLHMPGMDGYETAALIRGRKRTARTPIVFLTAIYRDEAHVFKAYSAGAVDMVFKPVDPFILRSKVSVLVDIYLRTEEARRLAAHRQWLLEENARIQASRLQAEQALRRSEAQQQAILQSLPIVFHARSATAPFAPAFVSEGVEAITGFSPANFVSDPGFGSSRIHPEDLARVVEVVSGAVRTGAYACEFRWRCADGTYRWLADQGVLAPGDDEAEAQIFGVIMDATERHELEERLAQAHKMEAVGQLTGGVAHDFNNLLTVVLGNIDIMARRSEEGVKRALRIDAIRQAAERGRDLTRQLLAFSRRQNLQPVTVDVRRLVEEFCPLIRQAVGDATTVRLDLGDNALRASIDVTQMEAALLNLAVNARDAMEGGGTLTISASTLLGQDPSGLPAGSICLAIEDTGSGMSPEVQARVFEPFFTTKEVGRGSGLGLSQVYGFVQQSEGHVRISSEANVGTRFEILLPVSTEPIEAPAAKPVCEEMAGGSERILVAEDDPAVLRLTVDLLEGLGYQVVSATTADEALAILRQDPQIALLFSDVVMPGGTSGIALAKAAQQERNTLKVLLTSGFIGEKDLLDGADHAILDKPYEPAALAARLRDLLDGPQRAQSPRRQPRQAKRTNQVA